MAKNMPPTHTGTDALSIVCHLSLLSLYSICMIYFFSIISYLKKINWRVMWCAGIGTKNSHAHPKSLDQHDTHSVSFLFCLIFCMWSWFYIHLSAALGEDEHAHCWWQHSPLYVHADGSHTHRPGYQTGIRCVLTSWLLSSTPVHLCFYQPLWHSTSMPSSLQLMGFYFIDDPDFNRINWILNS